MDGFSGILKDDGRQINRWKGTLSTKDANGKFDD